MAPVFSEMIRRTTYLGIITLFIISSTENVKIKQKTVTTFLDSKWRETPILLEISEYLADENNEYFWAFIDIIGQQNMQELNKKNDKDYHDFLVGETRKFLSAPKMSLLKLSLSLRAYSPKIIMFHQISSTKNLPKHCDVVAEVNGNFICDVGELEGVLEKTIDRNDTDLFKLDHRYPRSNEKSLPVILYAQIGTESFYNFHFVLKKLANEGKVNYILRHYLKVKTNQKVRLSGYGVELAIKSTEYKAQDDTRVKSEENMDSDVDDKQDEVEGFVFSKLKELYPEKTNKLEQLKNYMIESTNEMTPLKVWQIQELSLQASQRIMSTSVDEALRLMRDIAQNFPLQTNSLIKTVVNDQLKKEIIKNQKLFAENHNIASSESAIFINGIYFDVEVTDIFTLLDILREEQTVMDGLHALGVDVTILKDHQIQHVLSLDFKMDKQNYAVDIRDSSIQYINDLESDRKYYSWSSSLSEILRPTFPGVLRMIRKNIYHLVFVLDPSQEPSEDLLKLAESFYIHNAPVRIGILFTVNRNLDVDGFADPGVALLNAFNFISQEKNQPYLGLSFITDVYASANSQPMQSSDVLEAFKIKYPNEDLELIFGADSDYDSGRKLSWEFMDQTGLAKSPQVLLNGIPLDEKALNTDMFEEAVLNEILQQTTFVQKAVYKNQLSDHHNILDFLMSQPNVMPRLNDKILSGKGTVLDFTGRPNLKLTYPTFPNLSTKDMSATLIAHLKYFTARDDYNFRPITHWIVCDLETKNGRELLHDAIEQVKISNDIRVGVIYNTHEESTNFMSKIIETAITHLNKSISRAFIDKILTPVNADAILTKKKTVLDFLVKGMDGPTFKTQLDVLSDEFLQIHRFYTKQVLNIKPGMRAVITNGKILGPIEDDEVFGVTDLNLLEKFSLSMYGEKLRKTFQDINEQGELDSISDLAMRTTALLLSRTNERQRHEVAYDSSDFSVVKIPSRLPGQPSFDIKAISDPVSRGAQKLAPILMTLYEVVNAKIWLFLNSEEKLSDVTLKSFYRYVLEPQMQFLPNGSATPGPMARFSNMPSQPLLTQRIVTPDNWLVEVIKSPYDLDNIHLENVKSVVFSEYELEYLLLEGHCFEQATGNPPRGLQFTLGTKSNIAMKDTIVMANLGYFQLKANPGAWLLSLRQGRSSEIYDIVNHDNIAAPAGSSDIQVFISSFKSHIIKLKVNKKPDKHNVDLLSEDGEQNGGIWDSIASTLSGSKKDEDSADNKINIFSVASGHLYERFIRIMMVSVLKHTKTPVKFWFLNNYLSPTLKDVLPYMAKQYGFEYELVQYQWPRWLHQQTEKQRTIWGYKILFLDVLFPLDVKKIIYVDADQIVRTDLKELIDFDLGGAPYGYTPFCDSRKDMDGFRFWKSGYWASHLQGRKYHISALYVVDLKRFRRIAAGDRLRGQYQGLSQDPNSLSNLDQDLPNNMLHQVAIKSLPQEWLWCETWCDDASKARAKTIDLCNNPKTKEPKLVSAMRIVPEWKGYDDEIKKFLHRAEEMKSKDKSQSEDDNDRMFHEEL
uniref:UDP-glucose:glycoprotein glucosyltransferase n=1 Tax=Strigamia maritima TaxID=126957 RepID=T1J9H3_STRMM